jgi:hypothetical protein
VLLPIGLVAVVVEQAQPEPTEVLTLEEMAVPEYYGTAYITRAVVADVVVLQLCHLAAAELVEVDGALATQAIH